MRDLIDERNRREKIKRSIIKRMNVNYISKEELERQREAEEKKKALEVMEQLKAEEAAQSAVLDMEMKKVKEQRELLERARFEASQPPSSRYGTKESDEVTKEQVEAILSEKRSALDQVIQENMKEE